MQRTKSGLIIAGLSAADQAVETTCVLCGEEFTLEDIRRGADARHMASCSDENQQVIEDTRERTQGFKENGEQDRELEEYVERNREAIIEGRKTGAYGERYPR